MGITYPPQYNDYKDMAGEAGQFLSQTPVPVVAGINAKWTLTNFTIDSNGYLDASAVAAGSSALRYIPGVIQGHLYTVTIVVTAVSGGGTNEVQTVGIDNATTSGTFTLTYDGQTTGTIAWNANAAAVKSALELLSNIDLVAVTGGPGPSTDWIVEFQGSLAGQNVVLMTGDGSLLVGGSTTVTVTETTPGVAPDINVTIGGKSLGTISSVGTYIYHVRPDDGLPLKFDYPSGAALTTSITSVIIIANDPMNLDIIPEAIPRVV